ncbi:MAG TPA: hypothetical protein VHB53_01615 [Solirubrobacterales bacterium]|nr:hypothetical protein [Solirubrobacterales bacterium]
MIGIVLTGMLAGCGGGSDSPTAPSPAAILQAQAKLRAAIKADIDSKLKKLDRPTKEIACVDRNVEAMTSKQIAERVIEPAPVEPPSKETATQVEGPLGRGCP